MGTTYENWFDILIPKAKKELERAGYVNPEMKWSCDDTQRCVCEIMCDFEDTKYNLMVVFSKNNRGGDHFIYIDRLDPIFAGSSSNIRD